MKLRVNGDNHGAEIAVSTRVCGGSSVTGRTWRCRSPTNNSASQKQSLPKLRNGITYREARKELMKLGCQPITLPTATPCVDDERCQSLPEVFFCSGVGKVVCIYMWKKEATLIRVYGSGESSDQNYYGLKPCPRHPTQFEPECGGRRTDSATAKSMSNISGSTECAFCGAWEYVGTWNQYLPHKSYIKISQAGAGEFRIVEGDDSGVGYDGTMRSDQETSI